MTERLRERACQRAQTTPGLIGHDLARLAVKEQKTIDELLCELNIEGDITSLLLCRSPRKECFIADIQSIADYAHIQSKLLISLLRKLQVLDLFSSSSPDITENTMLFAARELQVDDTSKDENYD